MYTKDINIFKYFYNLFNNTQKKQNIRDKDIYNIDKKRVAMIARKKRP